MPFTFFLQHIYKFIKHAQLEGPRDRENVPHPQEERAAVKGYRCPFLSTHAHLRRPSIFCRCLSPKVQGRYRNLSWGRGKRQTDSNPSESGKFQAALSEKSTTQESRGHFPELRQDHSVKEGLGEGRGGTLTIRTVLQIKKRFMELSGILLCSSREDLEDVDSSVEQRGGLGELLP